jgi:hypothetical protein
MAGFLDIAVGVANVVGGIAIGYPLQSSGPQASAQASEAARTASDADRAVHSLEDRLDRLTLACTAMWALIREKTDLTEEDLVRKVKELDLGAGQGDPKIGRQLAKCPQCGHVMSPRHRRCLYCGNENLSYGPFEAAL